MSMPTEHGIRPLTNIREVKAGSFIFERPLALSPAFCDEVIERFEAYPEHQHAGRIGQLRVEDPGVKSTTDLVVSNKEDWKDADRMFFRSLAIAIKEFRETFPYFKGPFKDVGYQIQRYRVGDFYHWHIDGGSHEFSLRQLVALWYLNDVAGPGGRDPVSVSGRQHPAPTRQVDPVSPLLDPRAPGGGAEGGGQVHRHHLGGVCLKPVLPWGVALVFFSSALHQDTKPYRGRQDVGGPRPTRTAVFQTAYGVQTRSNAWAPVGWR